MWGKKRRKSLRSGRIYRLVALGLGHKKAPHCCGALDEILPVDRDFFRLEGRAKCPAGGINYLVAALTSIFLAPFFTALGKLTCKTPAS
jgi:hypothetical protein